MAHLGQEQLPDMAATDNTTSPETRHPSTTPSEPRSLSIFTYGRDLEKASTTGNDSVAFDEEPLWPKGCRPWLCLVGCFFLMWNSWGLVNAYGTYQSWYSQHLFADKPVYLLNLIGSTQSFVVLSLSFIIGRLLDANHSRQLIAGGSILTTLSMFLLSVVNGTAKRNEGNYFLTWLTQGFLLGLGQACFFVSSSQIVSTYFIKRKYFAIGIVASGASVAGLVYPILFKFLLTEVGFNNAVRYNATLVGVTCIISFFLAVPNPNHKFRKPATWARVSVWIDPEAFKDAAWCWFTASICFVFFGFYAIFFNLEDWAAYGGFAYKDVPPGFDIGLGEAEVQNDAIRTFWMLCILNISSTAGRVLSATYAEKFGALNIHGVCTLIGSLLVLILWTLTQSLGPALAFVILFGAISGAIIGMPPASIAYILGRADATRQAKLGQWTGMMYTVAAPFALTGPVIAGYLVSKYGPNNYLTVQLWSGGCLFCASMCMAAARYCSGPSRTVDELRRLRQSISSVVTLTNEKGGVLTGLGRKMSRSGSATPSVGTTTANTPQLSTLNSGTQTQSGNTPQLSTLHLDGIAEDDHAIRAAGAA